MKLSVKLRVLLIHASDGLSDLTLRETPTLTRRSCDGGIIGITGLIMGCGLFSLNDASYPFSDFCDVNQPYLLTSPSIQGLRPGPCCPISPLLSIFTVTTFLKTHPSF